MGNNNIVINKLNGEALNVELVSFFELVNTGKKYLFYTMNETAQNGLIKMYVGEVLPNDTTISPEMTDEEWNMLKNLMRSMLTGNTDPNIKYLKWEA